MAAEKEALQVEVRQQRVEIAGLRAEVERLEATSSKHRTEVRSPQSPQRIRELDPNTLHSRRAHLDRSA